MWLDPKRAQGYRENKKIKGQRVRVSQIKDKIEKHTAISKLEPKESIPVLLQTLIEIDAFVPEPPAQKADNGNNDNNALVLPDVMQETRKVIDAAIKIFAENDEIQNAYPWQWLGHIKKLNKEAIVGGLFNLVSNAKNIKLTRETVNLWEECSLWLEGLYRRTFDKVPKGADGQPGKDEKGGYLTCDKEDGVFKTVIGLTKMDISNYYHEASLVIEALILEFRYQESLRDSVKNLAEVPPVVSVAEVAAEKSEDKIATEVKAVDEALGFVQQTEAGDHVNLNIILDKNKPELIERIRKTVEAILANPNVENIAFLQPAPKLVEEAPKPQEEIPDQLALMLNLVANDDEDVKIATLEFGLEECNLTDPQCRILSKFKDEAIANLNSYINRGNIRDWIVNRAHTVAAKEVIENLGVSVKPQDHLKELFKLRTDLIGKCSDDLIKKVNHVLLGAYTMLSRMQFDKQDKLSIASISPDNRPMLSMPALYTRKL